MIRVQNKKTVSRIARMTYKANKKRNLLTVFAVILTGFLLTAVVGVGVTYWNIVTQRELLMSGIDYDIALTEPRKEQQEILKDMEQVETAGLMVKCAMVTKGNDQYASMIKLYFADESCWEKQSLPAFETVKGQYPQKKNELFLSMDALKALGISKPQPRMKIRLTYYPMTEEDSSVYTDDFILSGYFTDYSGDSRGFVSRDFYEWTGVRQEEFGKGELYISLKNSLYTRKDIQQIEKAVRLQDRQIIQADPDLVQSMLKTMAGLLGLLLLIFASGYLFIYNTMYISVSKDIRYYAQLKTIGMTSGQLKGVIYRQALWNSCIGIPLGVAAGLGMITGLMPVFLNFIKEEAAVPKQTYATIALLAAAFSFLTVLISSRKPAVLAGKASVIEAMRYIPRGKRGNQGENGVRSMARRNIFRNKKQTAVILCSFTIALSLFFTVNILLREYDTKRVLDQISSSDLSVENETVMEEDIPIITEERLDQLKELDGVKNVRSVGSAPIAVPYQEEALGGYYERLSESRMTPGGDYEETMKRFREDAETENNLFGTRLIMVDEEEFQYLNGSMEHPLDPEEFREGKTAWIEKNYWCSPDEAVGKEVSFYFPGKSQEPHSVKIAAMCESPAVYAGGYSPQIIISREFGEKLLGDVCTEVVYIDYQESFSRETEQQVKAVFQGEDRINIRSKLMSYKAMAKTEKQLSVLGNTLAILLGILALLNYVNMMAAGIQSRAGEFAALESLGMTRRQLKQTLAKEGLGYGLISVGLTLTAGLPLGFLVFQGMNLYGVEFSIPVLRNLAVFAGALFICVSIPPVLYTITQKGSVIERMRRNL